LKQSRKGNVWSAVAGVSSRDGTTSFQTRKKMVSFEPDERLFALRTSTARS
jgi:hypothetical protein